MVSVWIRTLQLSVKSLWMHPLRSALTVLGIFIGVSSVIWLLALGEGISRAAQEQISSLGALNIILRTVKPSVPMGRVRGGAAVSAFDSRMRACDPAPLALPAFENTVAGPRKSKVWRHSSRSVSCTRSHSRLFRPLKDFDLNP